MIGVHTELGMVPVPTSQTRTYHNLNNFGTQSCQNATQEKKPLEQSPV